jgi:uroporphyrinogen-III synthase
MNDLKGFKGKVIVVTRPMERAQIAVDMIKENGGISLVVPLWNWEAFPSDSLWIYAKSGELDWIIFTSPASLESLFKYCKDFKENLNPHCKLQL